MVNASLNEVIYIVNEEDRFLETCVVLDGVIQREVVIQLSTTDGSAIGSYLRPVQTRPFFYYALMRVVSVHTTKINNSN